MSRGGVLIAAVGLVIGLVAGFVIGGRTDLLNKPTASNDVSAGAPVSLGPVRVVLEGPVAGADFELPVYNSTKSDVDATLVALEGATSVLRNGATRDIAPGEWTVLPFSVTPNCDTRGRRLVSSVRLRLRTSADDSERSLPLPEQGKVLLDYHDAICAAGPTILPRQLLGVWILQDVYGPDTYLAGLHLMRFGPDGSFAADPEGGLYSSAVGVRGRYRLRNELLTIEMKGGYACEDGTHVTWRLALDDNDSQLMSMVWINGNCPDGAMGDVWVARRVLRPTGLLQGQ
jgi:hypothetical protein